MVFNKKIQFVIIVKQAKTHCFCLFLLFAAFFTANHGFRGEKCYSHPLLIIHTLFYRFIAKKKNTYCCPTTGVQITIGITDRNTALHIKILCHSTHLKNQSPYNDFNKAESRLLSLFFNDPKINFSVSGVQYILSSSFALVMAV